MNYHYLSIIARKNSSLGSLLHMGSRIYIRFLNILPNTVFANVLSRSMHRGRINLKNPVTFNDKLWWLKFHYRNPIEKICSDKYRVKEYLQSLGEEYAALCLPMVRHYDCVEDICLSDFSEEVIFKLNVGSGANIIYNPSNSLSGEREREREIQSFFHARMNQNYYLNSREWNFKDVKPVIVVEKVLRDSKGRTPVDYKFLCFNGRPEVVFVSEGAMDVMGRHSVNGERFTNVYDMDWHLTQIESSYPRRPDIKLEKPVNYEKMKKIAAELSKPFPHVRIDLYNIDGAIYLGEFTFYHSGGCGNISPKEEAIRLGSMIDIDKIPSEFII